MSRFTKLASALCVVAALFVAAPAALQAHDPAVLHQEDTRQFALYLGSCPHSLEYYGVYVSYDAVVAVAQQFQQQGYFVDVRPMF